MRLTNCDARTMSQPPSDTVFNKEKAKNMKKLRLTLFN
ncbi:hypothetical protein PALB_30910 [Pseudoalteromonas luteoviolacea B = ATCC 29581]|nr:hypothetical protein PALB_30910 [Pseudoalteromonas luteoviolacea B = ATCC 29581]